MDTRRYVTGGERIPKRFRYIPADSPSARLSILLSLTRSSLLTGKLGGRTRTPLNVRYSSDETRNASDILLWPIYNTGGPRESLLGLVSSPLCRDVYADLTATCSNTQRTFNITVPFAKGCTVNGREQSNIRVFTLNDWLTGSTLAALPFATLRSPTNCQMSFSFCAQRTVTGPKTTRKKSRPSFTQPGRVTGRETSEDRWWTVCEEIKIMKKKV